MNGIRYSTLPRLFEECVSSFSEKTALVFEQSSLTYAELNVQANRLAHHLLSIGVRSGAHVGFSLTRSPELVIAILAIVKIGAVYVPLDPLYPKARLAFILEDAKIETLLTVDEFYDRFTDFEGNIVSLELLAEKTTSLEECNPVCRIDRNDKAYIMYTSGSTGKPKGVMVPHRGIVRLVRETDYIPFSRDLTFLLLSSISFDASTLELWGPLLNGGKCVILPAALPTLSALEEMIKKQKVNVLWLTAALFNTIIDEAPQILGDVDYLLTGGEALSLVHVRKAIAALPKTRLINGYGPTENTTFTCCYPIPSSLPEDLSSVPIGRPISGTYVRILDDKYKPVAKGEVGELFIGGEGLALGYLNRDELTSKAFIKGIFPEHDGEILYKSGDLVRMLPDGTIEFIGRSDNQLKIRGFRIEPGEIERRLVEHPVVKTAAIIPRKDVAAHTALVAFVTINGHGKLSKSNLKTFLKESLPSYMIPDFIEVLEKMPINHNGKVDRKVLGEKPLTVQKRKKKYCLTAKQSLVARLWRELLPAVDLAADENLLNHGVDSLTIMRFLSRLDEHGFTLQFSKFYENPTVQGIEESMMPCPTKDKLISSLYLNKAKKSTSIPLSAVQQSVFFLDRLFPGNPAYRFQAAIHFNGEIQPVLLEQAVTEIIKRHEILRTTFPEKDGRGQQVIHPPWDMKIPIIGMDGFTLESEGYKEAVYQLLKLPILLDRLPLFHHRIIRLRQNHHVMVIVEHHLIHDGSSFASMICEIVALYSAALNGESAQLPELSIQYGQYAFAEKQWLKGDQAARHVRFWKKYLRGAPTPLSLAYDYPQPDFRNFEGAMITTTIDHEWASAFRKESEQHGISLFTFMLAVYFLLLHNLTGQKDIVVGSGVANRLDAGVQNMLGMFVNTIPIRGEVVPAMSFGMFCKELHDMVIQALQHQRLPFKNITQAAGLKTRHGEAPLISTMFNFHDSRFPNLEFAGAKAAIEYLHNDSAKFDINIIVIPDATNCMAQSRTVHSGGMLLLWEYSTELFKKERMEHIVRCYTELLRSAVGASLQRIADFNRQDNKDLFAMARPGHLKQASYDICAEETAGTDDRATMLKFSRGSLMSFEKALTSLKVKAPIRRPFLRKTKKILAKFGNQKNIMNVTEQLLVDLWQEVLEIDAIEPQDNFFDLGGDSLAAVVLSSRVYQLTGTELPVSSLFKNPTVSGLASAIIENQPEKTDLVLHKNDSTKYLFFFHGDFTGGGLYVRKLIKILDPDCNIIVLHPQGQPGQPLPQPIEIMAKRYIEILKRHQRQGPYYLTGHCNGSLVAYEVARMLLAEGESVGALLLLDPATPDFTGTNTCSQRDIDDLFQGRTVDDIKAMAMAGRAQLMLEAYRRICRGYVIKSYPGRTMLILARNSVTITEGRADGWIAHVPSLETFIVPGGHHSMILEHVESLAKTLSFCLNKAKAYEENA